MFTKNKYKVDQEGGSDSFSGVQEENKQGGGGGECGVGWTDFKRKVTFDLELGGNWEFMIGEQQEGSIRSKQIA